MRYCSKKRRKRLLIHPSSLSARRKPVSGHMRSKCSENPQASASYRYFIINPAAGQGAAAKIVPEIERALAGKGLHYEIYETVSAGDCCAFVRKKAQTGEKMRFYVCGGDGTLHEAVNGAYGFANAAIGIIPIGTGNDFVKNFSGRRCFSDILAQILGEEIAVDLLCVNGKVAVNMINIGFDCDVVVQAGRLKKNRICQGVLAYIAGLCMRFVKPMGAQMEMTMADGARLDGEFLLCTIANGSFCGGAFQSSPYAQIDDGLFDFAAIRKQSRCRLLAMLPAYQRGTYLEKMQNREIVYFRQCSALTIRTPSPMLASIDGEIASFTALKIGIVKGGVHFIVPRGAAKKEKPAIYSKGEHGYGRCDKWNLCALQREKVLRGRCGKALGNAGGDGCLPPDVRREGALGAPEGHVFGNG